MAEKIEFVFSAVLEITRDEFESTGRFTPLGIPMEIGFQADPQKHEGVSVKTDEGVFTIRCTFPRGPVPTLIYVTYEEGRFLSLFINGALVDFCEVRGRAHFPDSSADARIYKNPLRSVKVHEVCVSRRIPWFADRYRLHTDWAAQYQVPITLYPVFQYSHPLISRPDANLRDPSEILHIESRYYVYFTLTPLAEFDGFHGSVWVSSCADTDDPADTRSWSPPQEVITKGSPRTDHDGTGCFTPDCFTDGTHVFVFYTALNSTHPRGFPQWPVPREPEHIFVAKSTQPDGGFVKNPKRAIADRVLEFAEAVVPGGNESFNGAPCYDVSLLDHGQCWVMDDGERRYYYKGGGGPNSHCGAVCVIRDLDENWLNGHRHSAEPIIQEDSHLEGILITRVEDQLFLQLQIFGRAIGEWITYVSDAADGLNWRYLGGGHRPRRDDTYPLSIGVDSSINPTWGIGQFRQENGQMMLGYLRVL